jgi:hypothetical protein
MPSGHGAGFGQAPPPGGYGSGWGQAPPPGGYGGGFGPTPPPGGWGFGPGGPPAGGYAPPYGHGAWAPSPGKGDRRLATLGIVCIVLGILKILWVLYEIASSAFALFAVEAMASLVRSTKVTLPAAATKAIGLVQDMTHVAAFTTMGRVLPFGVLAVVQIWLGAKAHGMERSVLRALRKLAWWSWGAIAASLLVQAVFVIPRQLDFARELLDDLVKAVPWPGGISPLAGWSLPSPLWAVTAPVLVAVAQSTWPIVLWIWTGRLLADEPG